MEIRIKLEVENVDEVLKAHKGEIMGFIADVVMSKNKKRYRVEKAVCERIVEGLAAELPLRLEEELVKTKISFLIEADEPPIAPLPD